MTADSSNTETAPDSLALIAEQLREGSALTQREAEVLALEILDVSPED